MAHSCRLDVLEWLSSLCVLQFGTLGRNGWTLVHEACESNSVPILEWILMHSSIDADVWNVLDDESNHAIHTAARFGNLDCLKWICEKSVSFGGVHGSKLLLSLPGNLNRTILHFAAMSGELELLEWLYTVHRADFSSSFDLNGLRPIHFTWRKLATLKWMVNVANCDITARVNNGWQLLHFAIFQNKLDVVQFIVANMGQACLDAPIPNCGRTAAHFAASEAMCELLWSLGANFTLRSHASKTLFELQTSLRPWLASKGIFG